LEDGEYTWNDFAILVRANSHAESFVRAFTRLGIPFQFLGPAQLYRQPEIKELISYLKVLNNFEDSVSLYHVLSMEYFQIDSRDLVTAANFARRINVSLFESLEVITSIRTQEGVTLPKMSDAAIEQFKKIVVMVSRHLSLLTKETAGQLLFYFLQDSGILSNILKYKFPLDEKKANNISKFFGKLKSYEAEHEDSSVAVVLDWLLLSMEMGESPLSLDTDWTENDAVNILTVHSSKGLEFPVVFLVNLVAQRFPTNERKEQIPIPTGIIKEKLPEGDYHLEEERRLFYVGMTRARDRLFLTSANYYGEGKREKKISPFIYEALGQKPDITQIGEEEQLSLLDWNKPKEVASKPQPPLKITYLSYSQIETFKTCPLHYKLKNILKIPSPISAAASFGNSIHKALFDLYTEVKNNGVVSEEILLSLFEKNWQREGYADKKYETAMRERGRKYLHQYWEKEYTTKVKPLALEEKFSIPIGGARFLKIGGRLDRVDDLGNGSIEIIDYKTGRRPSKKELQTNLQLSMYAIAACEIPQYPFNRKPKKVKLSLYYFDTQEKISLIKTKEELEVEKSKILEIAYEIEHSDFRCSQSPICVHCEYQQFCGVT
jgi:DNA helicase-2/ATP-dependent DNA helicase PcrA